MSGRSRKPWFGSSSEAGSPAAKAVRNRISAVMRWAVAKGYRPDDPAGDAIAAALPRNGNTTRHCTTYSTSQSPQRLPDASGER